MTGAVIGVVLGPAGPLASAVLAGLGPAAARYDREIPPAVGPEVIVHIQPVDPDPEAPFATIGAEEWDRRAEAPIRAALLAIQAAHRHRARLIIVSPTVGMEGAAGLVALATASEGVRMLAKSAARRWGPEGIAVNVVAVAAAAYGLDNPDAARTPPALAPTALAGVTSAVAWLAAAEGMTGLTITADDGALMAP